MIEILCNVIQTVSEINLNQTVSSKSYFVTLFKSVGIPQLV
jgi:hypothetical protein